MRVMKNFGVFAVVALVLVGTGAIVWGARTNRVEGIRPDPAPIAASPVEAQPAPTEPGVAVPRISEWIARPRRTASPPSTPKIDVVEPWSGTDYTPELVVAARERAGRQIDRADPWTPGVSYPPVPGLSPELDEAPWARNDGTSAPHRVARNARTKAPELVDPWEADTAKDRSAKAVAVAGPDAPALPN
jgi:hypothetical protein